MELDGASYQRVVLAERPVGAPNERTFAVETCDLPQLREGEFLVNTTMLSLAPAMRGWLDATPTYRDPLEIGDPIPGRAAGEVIVSRHPEYHPGDIVVGPFGMATAAVSDGTATVTCDLELAEAATWLGLLDTNGLTAYFGLLDVGKLAPGDTVVVSAAAGSVGSTVVQLARLRGAGRVIGIAGGNAQCQWLRDIGVDVAIDYRAENIEQALAKAAPQGVDVFFDNVGGDTLEAVMMHLAVGARIVICGAISIYNEPGAAHGPANYLQLLFRRATMAGFITTDFAAGYADARKQLAAWYAAGQIVSRETIVSGSLDEFGTAFAKLFGSDKSGKLVLQLPAAAGKLGYSS